VQLKDIALVELQSLHWRLSRLEIEANNLTIHGLEPAGQVPLAHADRVYARVRIISFVDRQVNFRAIRLDRPVIHLIVNPDGSTNVPETKVKTGTNRSPVQQLFDLATNRAELRDGTLIMNERKLPLDFSASDVGAEMNYARFDRRYDGSVQVGKMDAQYQDYRDIAASGDAAFSLWQDRAEVRSLKLTSQRSSVELSGTIDDFAHPRIQINYGGTIDLAQAGEIVRLHKLRGGGLNVSGSATISEDNYSATGKIGRLDHKIRLSAYGEPSQ
jgi:translocation and assembly module TamB